MNNNNIKFIILLLFFLVVFFIINSPTFFKSNYSNKDNKNVIKENTKEIDYNNNNNNYNKTKEDNTSVDNSNKINKNIFGISYFKTKNGKKIKIAEESKLKEYPFPKVDLKTRYSSHYIELKTSMYKKFPDIGKRLHYCKDLFDDSENATISFQPMYPSHEPIMELYFNHYFDFPPEEIPEKPNSKIPRVLHSLEPPYQRFCTEYEHCSNKFNWSISYERLADIRTGHCDDEEIFQVLPWELDKFVMYNKTKFIQWYKDQASQVVEGNGGEGRGDTSPSYPLASWFCSKCNIHLISNRLEYVKEMMKYVKVDSYGSCLNNVEQSNKTSRLAADAMDIKQSIISNYKFYLAFESSNCLDYTTEKPLHALKVGSVPIVMGHPQTLKYLPEGSYIYVGDFNSAKDLTDYLKFLDSNPDEYLKYFDWRFNQSIIEKWRFINGYPFRPNSRNWVCPLFKHYQNWIKGDVPSKNLHSVPYNDLCLPPNFIKI